MKVLVPELVLNEDSVAVFGLSFSDVGRSTCILVEAELTAALTPADLAFLAPGFNL